MLEAINLSKSFRQHQALKNLNLKIELGQIYCLLGANGAGKTTTINLFMNFIQPTTGEARINGLDVTKHGTKTKEFVAYIPENLMLYPNLTGMENLVYFSKLAGKNYDKKQYEAFLNQVGLQRTAFDRRVSSYSKGMRQKVGIALALAKDARALLLDEPVSGLDPKASNEFSNLLLQLKEEGLAILMATHDLFRARETGTHIGIMNEGKLVASVESQAVSHPELESLYLEHMN
ncbi:MAG: ABC transporter ATP-binding protein [Bacteroidota bacterium]